VTVRDDTTAIYGTDPMPNTSPYTVAITIAPGTRPTHATPPVLHDRVSPQVRSRE
jgi:hypothetical protein